MYKLYFDGAARNNQSKSLRKASYGFVIYKDVEEIKTGGKYLGNETNNYAEYMGLYKGLETCKKLNIKKLNVFGDSKLIINQLNGIYKVKNKKLKEIYDKCIKLVNFFDKITFKHVYRKNNKRADEIANKYLI